MTDSLRDQMLKLGFKAPTTQAPGPRPPSAKHGHAGGDRPRADTPRPWKRN